MLNRDQKRIHEYLRSYLSSHKKEIFTRNISERTRYIRIVIEDLFHAHNVSAVLRSCECFGIQNVHILNEGEHNPKHFQDYKRVARGSAQWLTLVQHPNYEDYKAQHKNIRTVALSPHAEKTLYELPLDQPLALIFGQEWEGVSTKIMEQVDETVRIPMFGFTESFNISVTVALCLQDLTQRLRQSSEQINWQLSPEEQEEVLLHWTRQAVKHTDLLEKRFWEDQN